MVSATLKVSCTPTTIIDALPGNSGATSLVAIGFYKAAFQSFFANIFQLLGSIGGQALHSNM